MNRVLDVKTPGRIEEDRERRRWQQFTATLQPAEASGLQRVGGESRVSSSLALYFDPGAEQQAELTARS